MVPEAREVHLSRKNRKVLEERCRSPVTLQRGGRRFIEQLQNPLVGALSKGINAGDSEATEAIRDLVETGTVFRDPSRPDGVTVEIAGRLTALLNEPVFPANVRGVKIKGGSESTIRP